MLAGFLGLTVPQRRGSETQRPRSCLHRRLADVAGTPWSRRSMASPAEMDAGGSMSHRHVRSSGRGRPAVSGIISLRGQEQGAGGSWGTMGSECRRPCLPTYEALAVSREACPWGSKDTPSTLSWLGAGALADGQQRQELWEWGVGMGVRREPSNRGACRGGA